MASHSDSAIRWPGRGKPKLDIHFLTVSRVKGFEEEG